ncbi:MAG: hypothetical protein JST09_11240 [Bacteroidetes bacterium]|nr:hypothetical protein [Bacteroidota bacterium]MBS1607319.1 hypothetical protein [Bacteroidota bacterium]
MEEVQKRRRKKHRRGSGKRKFWRRFILYFLYFSAIFLSLYYFFDRSDMLKEMKKDPDIFCWKVFGSSLVFALGMALWMRKDPKLTGK